MSDKRASEAARDMYDCAQAVAEKLNPKDPNGALRVLADRIQQNNAEPQLPETYPADWPKLRDVYVGLLAQEQTREVRDRRREMLSLALGKPEDFQYGLLKKLSDYFAVTATRLLARASTASSTGRACRRRRSATRGRACR